MKDDNIINPEDMSTAEAHLLWDEYKYRHDLIWKHMIRSTSVVVTLILLEFTNVLSDRRDVLIWEA